MAPLFFLLSLSLKGCRLAGRWHFASPSHQDPGCIWSQREGNGWESCASFHPLCPGHLGVRASTQWCALENLGTHCAQQEGRNSLMLLIHTARVLVAWRGSPSVGTRTPSCMSTTSTWHPIGGRETANQYPTPPPTQLHCSKAQ